MTALGLVLDAIDEHVNGCGWCGGSLAASPSEDFCGQDCQSAWHSARAVAIEGYREPLLSWATLGPAPEGFTEPGPRNGLRAHRVWLDEMQTFSTWAERERAAVRHIAVCGRCAAHPRRGRDPQGVASDHAAILGLDLADEMFAGVGVDGGVAVRPETLAAAEREAAALPTVTAESGDTIRITYHTGVS